MTIVPRTLRYFFERNLNQYNVVGTSPVGCCVWFDTPVPWSSRILRHGLVGSLQVMLEASSSYIEPDVGFPQLSLHPLLRSSCLTSCCRRTEHESSSVVPHTNIFSSASRTIPYRTVPSHVALNGQAGGSGPVSKAHTRRRVAGGEMALSCCALTADGKHALAGNLWMHPACHRLGLDPNLNPQICSTTPCQPRHNGALRSRSWWWCWMSGKSFSRLSRGFHVWCSMSFLCRSSRCGSAPCLSSKFGVRYAAILLLTSRAPWRVQYYPLRCWFSFFVG